MATAKRVSLGSIYEIFAVIVIFLEFNSLRRSRCLGCQATGRALCDAPITPANLTATSLSKIVTTLKARANARNIVGPNLLRAFAYHVVCCCDLLEVVG